MALRADLGGRRPRRDRVAERDRVQGGRTVVALGRADDTERQPVRGDERRTFVDEGAYRGLGGGPDDLGRRDQRAQPVRDVDDVLPRDPREEVLVAAGDADDLVRQHRTDDERDVVLDDRAVEVHGDVDVEPTLRQLAHPGGRDRPEVGEGLRVPPLVVADVHSRIGRLQSLLGVAEVGRQRLVAHRGVGTQRHQHGHPGGSAGQRRVNRLDQQGKRHRAGPVGDEDTDAAPVDRVCVELLSHERRHLVGGQDSRGIADRRGGEDHGLGQGRGR